MRGFRRSSGGEHIVHAIELPELGRRRPRSPRREGTRGEAPRPIQGVPLPAAPAPEPMLTHGHRPEDGAKLRTVEIPRPAPPARGMDPVDQARIEMLERRLAKLSKALEDRTAQLQLRMEHSQSEAGLASVYNNVQGLRGESEEIQRKRGLMASIFEANRKLRERVGSGTGEAE